MAGAESGAQPHPVPGEGQSSLTSRPQSPVLIPYRNTARVVPGNTTNEIGLKPKQSLCALS